MFEHAIAKQKRPHVNSRLGESALVGLLRVAHRVGFCCRFAAAESKPKLGARQCSDRTCPLGARRFPPPEMHIGIYKIDYANRRFRTLTLQALSNIQVCASNRMFEPPVRESRHEGQNLWFGGFSCTCAMPAAGGSWVTRRAINPKSLMCDYLDLNV